MNKNLLIKQNNELFNRINILKNSNAALKIKIEKLNSEIEGYKQKIAELENELTLSKFDKAAITPEPVIIEEISEVPSIKPLQNDAVELSDEFVFASDVIGNIVIKAASSIENLSNNQNKKELVNLILGKTEIAKAEILNIVSSEVSFDAKKDLIDTQYNDAVEYFKSILEQ